MNCVECNHPMIPDKQRRGLAPEERKKIRPHRGRGLCNVCQARARRAGTLIDYDRKTLPNDLLVEEAHMLMFDRGCTTLQAMGEALGMTAHGVGRGLLLAARAGDERAILIRSRLPTKEAA